MRPYIYIYCTPRWRETIYIICVYRNRPNQPWFIMLLFFFGPAVIFLPITTKHVFRKTQSAAVKIQRHILWYSSAISKYIIWYYVCFTIYKNEYNIKTWNTKHFINCTRSCSGTDLNRKINTYEFYRN